MIDFVENEHVKIWIEDDIVHGLYKKNSIIGLKAAQDIVEMRLKFQKGKIYKGIAYTSHMGMISPEARKYLAEAGYQGVDKVAVITNSHISNLIGNLFILINKPPKPTRLFKDVKDAIEWLREK
jgi:hypothetical protein